MVRLNQEEGRYRVLLMGIGDNTEEEKGSFCRNLSKNYSIPFPLLRKIVDGSPIILKKNISFKKADALAKTLRSFGARVSVEERRNLPPLSLEFQELTPHQLALESYSLRRTQRGAWSVTGRAKNISDQTLTDTWVLVQLFEDLDEFIAFEETPLAINPLPSGEASPFKLIFEGDLFVKRISIAFKNASGQPIPAVDKRRKREWIEVPTGEERHLSSPRMSTEFGKRAQAISLTRPAEKIIVTKEKENPRETAPSSFSPTLEPLEKVLETSLSELEKDGHLGEEEPEGAFGQETSMGSDSSAPAEMENETEEDAVLGDIELASDETEVDETPLLSASKPQDAPQLPEGVTEIPEEEEAEEEETAEEEAAPSFAWIESFRNAVKTYYEKPHDIFSTWFGECQKGGEFKDSFHALLTLLVHCRFEQGHPSVKALENTKRVFGLIAQPNVSLGEIPALEGTPFASGEVWRDLFCRALPKIRRIGNAILERNKWNASDLEASIQVIPHMDHQSSRRAIQWINELIRDAVEVDFSDTPITIGKGLYRVASRLGIVDPHSEYYQGRSSTGDIKIQSFVKAAFPQNPWMVEEPMAWMGRGEEEGGHCFPIQPWCEGCLFETFCSKLCVHFDPSEDGMRE
ncbi:MAG TPA: hypothetical protein VK568_07385 [Thermodesulfobacteriota bacterium]|jgi:hypothetical protein|nr:hypothetical protein [Thermodesulfobacteriota bacterium]